MSGLEMIAVALSVIAVTLTLRRHILCWGFNFVAAGLYGYLFYRYQLYAETLLQGCFMAMAIYGFIRWQHADSSAPDIQNIKPQQALLQGGLTTGLGLGLGLLLQHYSDAAVPILDAQLAAFSLLATYWASRKYVSTWLLWIIIDILYVGLFCYKALWLTASLYAAFIGLAVMGYIQWQRLFKQQKMRSAAHVESSHVQQEG